MARCTVDSRFSVLLISRVAEACLECDSPKNSRRCRNETDLVTHQLILLPIIRSTSIRMYDKSLKACLESLSKLKLFSVPSVLSNYMAKYDHVFPFAYAISELPLSIYIVTLSKLPQRVAPTNLTYFGNQWSAIHECAP